MILEALNYAATRVVTAAEFRQHIRSSVSLWSRANRCAKAWAPHEANCKTFIRETVAGVRERRTAVVLGSGLLRDVPIDLLAKTFDTVVLIDLVHLASVRFRARRFRNVRLISRDLSGFNDAVGGKAVEPLGFLRQVPYLDLVISANILSQIGVGTKRLLERQPSLAPDDTVAKLIGAHLDGLAGLPCRTALLTDISYTVTDRAGKISEQADLLCGVAPPVAKQSWQWPVAPFGELSRDHQAVHAVIAV